MVPIDDEAGDDIESEKEEETVVELVPVPVSASKGMKPPPRFAAIAEQVAVPVEGIVSYPDRLPEGPAAAAEDATMTEGQRGSGFGAPSMDVGVSVADDEVAEPASKRPRMTVMRVGDETLCHMGLEPMELCDEVKCEEFAEYDEFWNDDFQDETVEDENSIPSGVWQPFSEAQPEIHGEQLAAIDIEADKVEIDRLLQMGVITTADKYDGSLDTPLSAKMVRTWRKKQREEKNKDGQAVSTTAWLRRSRLVGRDFNFLEYREDVYSPASSSAVVKLLPCMALTNAMGFDWMFLMHFCRCRNQYLERFLLMVPSM